MRLLVRATNWIGDAVMSLPALHAVRARFPQAHITIQARPWVADLYRRESFCDDIVLHTAARGGKDWRGLWRLVRTLRDGRYDTALLLPNSFESALVVALAGIPRRIGYRRDGRGWLLTDAVPVPRVGDTPAHQRYYYLELLRRVGWLDALPPESEAVRLGGAAAAGEAGRARFSAEGVTGTVVGVSPGAAFGGAKRWLPERFADAAAAVARERDATVALFGSGEERTLCDAIAADLAGRGLPTVNFAGHTSLAEYIERAAACSLYLTNDSGGMHIASALGVPTVAVFGATDHIATGPTGSRARIVREPVACSPCLKRECPIDHRCMTGVPASRVAQVALDLLK